MALNTGSAIVMPAVREQTARTCSTRLVRDCAVCECRVRAAVVFTVPSDHGWTAGHWPRRRVGVAVDKDADAALFDWSHYVMIYTIH
mmetsp:Transcript_11676/g.30428  ORF Transcript_11676/g.30428 Transcript_11676/m.30428 type:complete len:87 (-) Transcript_11676:34-294(-)